MSDILQASVNYFPSPLICGQCNQPTAKILVFGEDIK